MYQKGTAGPIMLGTRNFATGPYLRALRPHQWLKNILVALPAIAHHDFRLSSLIIVVAAMIRTFDRARVDAPAAIYGGCCRLFCALCQLICLSEANGHDRCRNPSGALRYSRRSWWGSLRHFAFSLACRLLLFHILEPSSRETNN